MRLRARQPARYHPCGITPPTHLESPARPPLNLGALWIQASDTLTRANPLYSDGQRSVAATDATGGYACLDLVEGGAQNLFEPAQNFLFAPKEPLQVLYPLEVRDDYATCITEDIRNDENVRSLIEDGIGSGGRRSICTFREDSTLELTGIRLSDDALDGRRHENRAGTSQQFGRIDPCL